MLNLSILFAYGLTDFLDWVIGLSYLSTLICRLLAWSRISLITPASAIWEVNITTIWIVIWWRDYCGLGIGCLYGTATILGSLAWTRTTLVLILVLWLVEYPAAVCISSTSIAKTYHQHTYDSNDYYEPKPHPPAELKALLLSRCTSFWFDLFCHELV